MAKQDLFGSALAAEGVSGALADVARSIYQQESSSGRNTKTSNAGAMGGMQIVPSTFASVADKGWDIANPEHNLRAGIRYLKQMDKLSGGVPELTAAGYYSGPGGMAKAKKGVAVFDPRNPNAPSQIEYGRQVAGRRPGGAANQVPMTGVVADAPAQVVEAAQAVAPTPVEEASIAATVPQGPDQWESFLQNYQTRKVQSAEDLSTFGSGFDAPVATAAPPSMVQSMSGYAPQAQVQPNFRAFSGLRGRA